MFNIVEICKTNDKKASYLKVVNESIGHDVYEVGSTYVITLTSDNVWCSGDLTFRYMKDGTYLIKGNEIVFQG